MAQQDKTPDQAMKDLVEAVHRLIEHASTIAHAKRAFYQAYIAEGFTEAQALELCKDLSKF